MNLPIVRKQPAQMQELRDLSGGLNMRDGISEVLDNQLTDCKNMWWKDGLLKTRAAMIQNDSKINLGAAAEGSASKIRQHNCYNTVSGIKGQLCSAVYNSKINFFWNYGKSITNIASISAAPSSYFVCQYSDKLYCFMTRLTSQVIYSLDLSVSSATWNKIDKDKMHIPKVMMQCKKSSAVNISSDQINGVMLESYNLLSDYYEMSYNSYNPEIVKEEDQKHKMQYHILKSVAKYEGKGLTVTAEVTLDGNTEEHTVSINEESRRKDSTKVWKTTWEESAANSIDKLLMRVWKNRISFYYCEDNADGKDVIKDNTKYTKVATISDNTDSDYWRNGDSEEEKAKPTAPIKYSGGGDDDIVITAPYIWSNSDKEKIFNMTRCEWFGGSAGLSGGTRLFLCGNTKKGNSDLVVWSGLNNPLYFPENSYFNVGNETGAVTGFGKQSDKLVIFKENETWFTQYAQNTSITAQDLINQRVIDYASSSVYFPLTQINSNIGCPYPDTIQLCRNRLVWLGNNNSVYTLVSESQYNERSIFSVSEMVNRKIEEIGVDSKACACDWNGYYCLLLGNKMLLMDYNCYGYTHVASYSKQEDANVRIPWYYWEVSNVQKMTVIGDCLSMVDIINMAERYYVVSYCFDTKGVYDKLLDVATNEYITTEIDSYFTTKIFDFTSPHIRKNIEQINLQVGNNGGVPIKVFFITENGTEQSEIITTGNDLTNYTAGYIDSRAVFPCIKQILRFGIKVECKGKLAVDSVILKYRTTGGAR